jgi:hypothetical protein
MTITSASSPTPDATSTVKGKHVLANDLGGTAAAPTVVATHLSAALPVLQGGTGVTASDPVIQRVSTQTGAVATGTTTMPNDDTIPQNTEGDQYMSLAITPKNSANILTIEVTIAACSGGGAGAQTLGIALFQDTTANALAALQRVQAVAGYTDNPRFTHTMAAGTTSATTFKVRAGSDVAGTFTFNGAGAARKLGGVLASSIIITETAS